MLHIESFGASPASEILQNTIAFEKASALEQLKSQSSVSVIIRATKPGVSHIGIIVDNLGRSLPWVNAVASDKIVLRDATRSDEYPNIIVNSNNYNLEAILKKLSEYLFLNFQLHDVTIHSYNGVKSFKDQQPTGTFDPKAGKLQTTA